MHQVQNYSRDGESNICELAATSAHKCEQNTTLTRVDCASSVALLSYCASMLAAFKTRIVRS
jgi:hypothetical protein